MIVMVMGVSGSGKTTVGAALARRLNAHFVDADDHHSPEAIERMRQGIPLETRDRAPWLRELASILSAAQAKGEDLVVASSALKRAYRDLFRSAAPGVRFVHLDGSPERIRARIEARTGHFMPAHLLDSQFAALERPGSDEDAIVLDVSLPVDELVERAARRLE